jgi:hypothetical protein
MIPRLSFRIVPGLIGDVTRPANPEINAFLI